MSTKELSDLVDALLGPPRGERLHDGGGAMQLGDEVVLEVEDLVRVAVENAGLCDSANLTRHRTCQQWHHAVLCKLVLDDRLLKWCSELQAAAGVTDADCQRQSLARAT